MARDATIFARSIDPLPRDQGIWLGKLSEIGPPRGLPRTRPGQPSLASVGGGMAAGVPHLRTLECANLGAVCAIFLTQM